MLTVRDAADILGVSEDEILKAISELKPKPCQPYLKVNVKEDASKAEVDDIVAALATISTFFGVLLDENGGGSGGNPVRDARSNVESQPSSPKKPSSVNRRAPKNDQHDRIGDRG